MLYPKAEKTKFIAQGANTISRCNYFIVSTTWILFIAKVYFLCKELSK